jgi:hypothetical protein
MSAEAVLWLLLGAVGGLGVAMTIMWIMLFVREPNFLWLDLAQPASSRLKAAGSNPPSPQD